MGLKSARIDKSKKELHLVLDLDEEGRPSASGKTKVVATSQGNQPTDQQVNGKVLVVGVNAYYKP